MDNKKLKQVFKLAGKVQSVDLSVDKDGNSRGFAVVEYDHPVEAVQAISMLDRQMLYDRRMTVRLDRIPDKGEGLKLPDGLGGVGVGLGPNGEPLKDVARNLPNILQQQQNQQPPPQQMPISGGNLSMGGPNMGAGMNSSMSGSGGGLGGMFGGNNNSVQPTPVAPVVTASKSQSMNSNPNLNLNSLSTSNLAALSNVVGGLGAALNNPLLTTSLNSLGLNLGPNQGAMPSVNDDSMSSTNAAISNNYSTGGNNYSSGFGNQSGFNSSSSTAGGGGGGGGYNSYNSSGSGNNSGPNQSIENKDFPTGGSMEIYGSNNPTVNNPGNSIHKSDTIIIKNVSKINQF